MLIKRLTIVLLFILTSASLIAIGDSSFNQLACEGQPINNNVDPTQAQQILGDRIIGQSFVSPHDGLNSVHIFFLTYQRPNTHDVTLRLLETSPDINTSPQVELFSTTFNAATIDDKTWQSFSFPQIPDSSGKTYLITLQSPQSVDGNAITVGGIERDVYASGSAFLGTTPVPADIAFRACYQMTIAEKLQILSEQITRNRPALWDNAIFFWGSTVVYVLLLIGFFLEIDQIGVVEDT